MGKVIRASVLTLLLACSAQAGIMGNESPAPPPQPATAQDGYMPNDTSASSEPTSAADETAADGWMGNGASLTQVAWEVLAVLPSLL